MKRPILIVGWLLPLVLLAQSPPPRKTRPEPAGLKVLSTTIDPETRQVTVLVQNLTNKIVVAYALSFHQFDKDGKGNPPEGYGVGTDHQEPDANPPETNQFIRPGQLGSIQLTRANPGTVSVTATIAGVVYEDGAAEGNAAQMFFNDRARIAREAKEAAAKEPPGERRTVLEKRAAFFEEHAREAQQ